MVVARYFVPVAVRQADAQCFAAVISPGAGWWWQP